MKRSIYLSKLKHERQRLENRRTTIEELPQDERNMDWLDYWSSLNNRIDQLTRQIEQEESWQAKSR